MTYSADLWKYYGQADTYFRGGEEALGAITHKDFTFTPDGELTEEEKAAIADDLDAATYTFADYTNAAEGKANAESPVITSINSTNYTLVDGSVITIKTYAPEVTFELNENNGNGEWFITPNAVTVTAKGFTLLDKAAYEALSKEESIAATWEASVPYAMDPMEIIKYAEASASANNTEVTRTLYVRNNEGGEDQGAIATTALTTAYKHDPTYFAGATGVELSYVNPDSTTKDQLLTTRTQSVTFTVGEESYVWDTLNGKTLPSALPTTEGAAKANKSTTTDVTTSYTVEGTTIDGESISATHIGVTAEMAYAVTDLAGNEFATEPVELVNFVPDPLSITYQLSKQADGAEHIETQGTITIHGQDGEMVTITRYVEGMPGDVVTFDAILTGGSYTITPSLYNDIFLRDGNDGHMKQHLVVSYTDAEHLDAETLVSNDFYCYDTFAFPITQIKWTNRSDVLTVMMPEAGTITNVTIQGANVALDGVEHAKGEVTFPVDLIEENLPTKSADVTIEYVDSANNTWKGTLANTGVDSGIDIEAIFQPVLLENDYFDARRTKTLQINIYGTEFERLNVELYDRVTGLKLSGTDQWIVTEQGNGGTQITMSGLPENRELECVISYVDINGPQFRKKLLFDSHCDEPIITSPVFEEMTTLTGIAEQHSVVYVMYQGERYKGTVDQHGYFEVEMPMLFADETFEVHCIDIAYNHTSYDVAIEALDVVETVAYPMGKLHHDDEDETWYMSTMIELDDEATEPVTFTRPVLAGASFEIGTCTYTVDGAKVTAAFDFSVDAESLNVKGASAATLTERRNAIPDGALVPVAFENNTIEYDLSSFEKEKRFYLVAQLDCELDIDYVMETYQSDDAQHAEFKSLQ